MAIATTGPLALKLTIRAEELIKSPSIPETDISTRNISDLAGFSEPDAFSEFYGYSSAVLPTMASIRLRGGPNDNYFNVGATPATNGFVAITSRGFYMGTDSRGPQYNTRYQVDTSNSLGEFNKSFTGLAASRTYYIWGYVQNQIGEGYTSRFAVTTLRAIPLASSGSFYVNLQGPMALQGQCTYSCSHEGFGPTKMQEFWDNAGLYGTTSCMSYDLDLRSYLDYAYLHPYYGWTGNGGVYAHRYEYASNCTYNNNTWYGSGWGASNHAFSGNVTTKKADNAATRQRNQMHTDTYVNRNGGYGTVTLEFSGTWARRDSGYFSPQTSYTREGGGLYFQNYQYAQSYISSLSNSGGYAPYYDWNLYQYSAVNLYNRYGGFRVNSDNVAYWYHT